MSGKNGKSPTLSKGTKKITLTPFHDVPMVFAAQKRQGVTPCEENVDLPNNSVATSSGKGRSSMTEETGNVSDNVGEGGPLRAGEEGPCTSSRGRTSMTEEAGHVSDAVGEGGPLRAGEGRPCASTQTGEEPATATRSKREGIGNNSAS